MTLEVKYKIALKALENLKKHMELVNSHSMLKLSSTYLIVYRALEQIEEIENDTRK